MDKNEKDTNRNINIYLSWIIVILLIIVCIITSFYSGKIFYELTNTQFGGNKAMTMANTAKWFFDAKIVVGDKIYD